MLPLPKPTDIPGYPICPACGSRFFQWNGESYRECPGCRDTSNPSYDERLTEGFLLLEQDQDDNPID